MVHRILEVLGLAIFLLFAALLSIKIVVLFPLIGTLTGFFLFLTIPLLAYLTADFASGLVHYLCDNFGTPETPWLGPGFIKPFRDHHEKPDEIVEHDFIEVNGNSCLAVVPLLVGAHFFLPIGDIELSLALTLFVLFFAIFVAVTNQLHKWAHQDEPPGLIRQLQKVRFVLSPQHHRIHHTAPYDKFYCITCGWLNPALTRTQVFERVGRLLKKMSGNSNVK